MTEELKPCPFCGERPRLTLRPDNAEGSTHFAAVACYCGGYSACAHKMAKAPAAAEAESRAVAAWNSRADLPAASGDTFYGLTLDQAKANLAVLGADDLRGLVVSLLIQQRIAERAFAATQPAPAEPVAWQWRKKSEPWTLDKTFNSQVYATTPDSEVRPLYAGPQSAA